jgi:SAM-dependent methyltransferase
MYETDQSLLLDRFLAEGPLSVVDLGAGLGHHTGYLLNHGRTVIALDVVPTASLLEIARTASGRCRIVTADLASLPFAGGVVDAIWASHCLEHMVDPLSALAEWRRTLRPGGVLGVAVPPFKTQVVGRHVHTGWTVGQLMVTLFRVGFDVRGGAFARHLYNICAIVRRAEEVPDLRSNDEILCRHRSQFPPTIEADILANRRLNPFGETISYFEGDIERLGW